MVGRNRGWKAFKVYVHMIHIPARELKGRERNDAAACAGEIERVLVQRRVYESDRSIGHTRAYICRVHWIPFDSRLKLSLCHKTLVAFGRSQFRAQAHLFFSQSLSLSLSIIHLIHCYRFACPSQNPSTPKDILCSFFWCFFLWIAPSIFPESSTCIS